MGVIWTEEQQKVISLRDRNILVSAAAGSGKTAVLVETYFKQDLRSEETSRHRSSSDHDVYPCGCRRNERTYLCGN